MARIACALGLLLLQGCSAAVSPITANADNVDSENLPNVDQQGQVVEASANQVANLRETFTALDKNRDGQLTADEMRDGLDKAGIGEVPSQLVETLKAHAEEAPKDEGATAKEVSKEGTAIEAAPEEAKEASSALTPETSAAQIQPHRQLEEAASKAKQLLEQSEASSSLVPGALERFMASSTQAPETPEMMEARITAEVKAQVQEQLLKEFEVMQARNTAHMEAEIRNQLRTKEYTTPAPETPLEMQERIKLELKSQVGKADPAWKASTTQAPETMDLEQMKAQVKAQLKAQMRDGLLKV